MSKNTAAKLIAHPIERGIARGDVALMDGRSEGVIHDENIPRVEIAVKPDCLGCDGRCECIPPEGVDRFERACVSGGEERAIPA